MFSVRKATSADATRFTATASSAAAAGSYDIEVINLASAHRLASDPVPGWRSRRRSATARSTITVGEDSFDVEIAQDANTLEDIRDAINDASDNTGVQATLLNGTEGTRLILTSRKTGAEHAIKVVASGGDGGLRRCSTTIPTAPMNLVAEGRGQGRLGEDLGLPGRRARPTRSATRSKA